MANKTTQHGHLTDIKVTVDGNQVYLNIIFSTADASGQNMVTIATQAFCTYIATQCPVSPQSIFLDGNMSGDKKASMQSFQSVRGKKVTSEVVVPKEIVETYLKTSPKALTKFCQVCSLGGVMSGTIGLQGHYANALAALYIATGQDAACVAESSVGITRFETTSSGDLYVSVTLPNLMVGTVGGGTGLPTQKACLDMMDLSGKDKGNALAEVCAAICLAGEISISAAFCSGDFARAHNVLARGRKKGVGGSK